MYILQHQREHQRHQQQDEQDQKRKERRNQQQNDISSKSNNDKTNDDDNNDEQSQQKLGNHQNNNNEESSDTDHKPHDGEMSRKRGRKGLVYEKKWYPEEIEKLIQLWSERGELYDSTHPKYHDSAGKSLILEEIAKQLQMSTGEVTKKMKSLQSYYLFKKREAIKANGGATGKPINWPYYNMLRFLGDNVTPNETLSYIPKDPQGLQTSASKSIIKDRTSKRNDFLTNQSKIMDKANSTLSTPNSVTIPCQFEKSDDEVFSEMVCKSMAKVPECDGKEELKIEILSLILQARRKLSSTT